MTDESKLDTEPTELDEIIADYICAEEAGEPVSRDGLLAKHSEYSGQLNQFFADRDQFRRLASPLSPEAARCSELPTTVRYFGDYELLEEIAQGGMGVVYKARQKSLNRIVALKMVLAGHLASDQDIKRFEEEARTAATLKHRSIVPIHEVGRQHGQHYFSMDYIDGRNLAEIIRTEPPSPDQAARIIKDLAEAVDYAHNEGIVHRDIKPSNILIDQSGAVRITDFGLALRVEHESGLTQTGQILGTPAYMPPEQALGKRDLVGPASDIYAMGAILYELLTGRPPFRGESASDTIRQLIDTEPLLPRQVNAKSPRDLETICLKCLAKEPHRRYGTAALLADDVSRFLAREPILARSIGRCERLVRWCRREPVVATLAASIVLILCVGISFSSYFATDAYEKARSEGEARRSEAIARGKAEVESTRANTLLTQLKEEKKLVQRHADELLRTNYNYTLNRAQQLLDAAPEQARALLVNEHRCPMELRDFARTFLLDRCRREVATWHHDHSVLRVVFAPNGGWIAAGDNGGIIRYANADTGEEILSIQAHEGTVKWLGFAPDGKTLASAGLDGAIRFWDANGDELSDWRVPIRKGAIDRLAFSPDGRTLAIAYRSRYIVVWGLDTGASLRLDHPDRSITRSLAFSPDGQILAAGQDNGTLRLWDPREGSVRTSCVGHEGQVWGLAFSPTGDQLASAGFDHSIRIWDPPTGAEKQKLTGHEGWVTSVAFLPNSDRELVSSSADGTIRLWRSDSSEALQTIRGHLHKVAMVSPGPNGRIVSASHDKTARIWDINSARDGHVEFAAHQGGVLDLAFSPTSGVLATSGYDHAVRLWDPSTQTLLRELHGHNGPVACVAYHPHGNILATSSLDGTIRIWSEADGRTLDVIQLASRYPQTTEIYPIRPLAFSPDGLTLAATSGLYSTSIILRTDESTQRVSLKQMSSSLNPAKLGGILCILFPPDGRTIAWGGGYWHKGVSLIDATTHRQRFSLEGHSGAVVSLAYAPQGDVLASASRDNTVCLWHSHNGEQIAMLRGHRTNVRDVAFSADGRTLASASEDATIILWDAETGQQRIVLDKFDSGVACLCFSNDGRTLASGLQDGTVRLSRPQSQREQ